MTNEPLLRMENIRKVFSGVVALDNVNLTLQKGEVHSLVGENGAGKSTLMKILSGYQPADSGQMLFDGIPHLFADPADALASGIGMLHQDPLDVPSLTVLENFVLGRPTALFPNWRAARAALRAVCDKLGFTLRPDQHIDTLTIGARQQAEIARLLSIGARLLILDEPTTGISAEQKETLFSALKRLATNDQMTVALVSHKLEDVEALCDQAVVLRSGKVVGTAHAPFVAENLVQMMFGKPLDAPQREQLQHTLLQRQIGPPALEAKNVAVITRRAQVHSITLDVAPGEVIGLAGLDGSGQVEFLRACAGLESPVAGAIHRAGIDMTGRGYHQFRAAGIAFTPAGRLEEGLIGGLTLTEHFALTASPYTGEPGTRLDMRAAQHRAAAQITRFNIRCTPQSEIQTLSGGNQQRTLLALLPEHLSVLLLEDPTRGLDVESARWIWSQLLARREDSTAILFTSPDLDEIMIYSDRIMVFYDGRATLIDDPGTLTPHTLGKLIGGNTYTPTTSTSALQASI